MFRTTRRKVIFSAVCLLCAAGAAYAAWTVSNNGTGGGKVGSIAAPTISAGTAVGDTLPSASATGSLAFQVNNPNATALHITDADASAVGGFTTTGGVCSSALFSGVIVSGLNISVPTGTTTVVIPALVKLDPSAPSTCQNATFTKSSVTLVFST